MEIDKLISTKWKNALLENAITPSIQQAYYTTGKNADSANTIDAMDILLFRKVDGFWPCFR
jgi:hypothetical protein